MNNPSPKYGEWIWAPVYRRTNERYQSSGTPWKSNGRTGPDNSSPTLKKIQGEGQGLHVGNLLAKVSDPAVISKVGLDAEASVGKSSYQMDTEYVSVGAQNA
ncbi:hypothetical protein ACOSP7_007732 [Xanthoceras sorbifolium]